MESTILSLATQWVCLWGQKNAQWRECLTFDCYCLFWVSELVAMSENPVGFRLMHIPSPVHIVTVWQWWIQYHFVFSNRRYLIIILKRRRKKKEVKLGIPSFLRFLSWTLQSGASVLVLYCGNTGHLQLVKRTKYFKGLDKRRLKRIPLAILGKLSRPWSIRLKRLNLVD